MNLATILIPAALIYLIAIIYVFKRYRLGMMKKSDNPMNVNLSPLTKWVKHILSFLYIATLLGVMGWPVFTLLMGISQLNNPSWGIDLTVFGKFLVDLNQLPNITTSGLRDPIFYGVTQIHIDTSNRLAWWSFAFTQEIKLLVALYAVRQLQIIVSSISMGDSFSHKNIQCIKNIGKLVIVWGIAMPIINFIVGHWSLNPVKFSTEALSLTPALSIDFSSVLIGVMLFLLAEVMNDALTLKNEQSLTI